MLLRLSPGSCCILNQDSGAQIGYWLACRSLDPSHWETIAQRPVLVYPYTSDVAFLLACGGDVRLGLWHGRLFILHGKQTRRHVSPADVDWQQSTSPGKMCINTCSEANGKQMHLWQIQTDKYSQMCSTYCKSSNFLYCSNPVFSHSHTHLRWRRTHPQKYHSVLRAEAASFDCVPNDNKWAIMGGQGGTKSSLSLTGGRLGAPRSPHWQHHSP